MHPLYINLTCVCKDIYVNEYWEIEFCILSAYANSLLMHLKVWC